MTRAADIRAYRALDRTCPHCGKSPAFPPCDAWSDGGPCVNCLADELAPKAHGYCRRCRNTFPLPTPKLHSSPDRKRRQPTKVQSLIFDSAKFTIRQAKSWAKKHGFASRVPDVTAKSVRLRQVEPDLFKRSSFRTITLTDGVKAVVGRPR